MDTDPAFSLALTLILLSALLHVLVNTLIKVSCDGLITRSFMNATVCVVAAPLLLFVPQPPSGLWPLLTISVLVHALYPFFLIEAYRYGDLSTSYPLIRGSVPLLDTAFAAIALGQLPGPVTLWFQPPWQVLHGHGAHVRAGPTAAASHTPSLPAWWSRRTP